MRKNTAYLRLSVTERCNLSCTYCRPPGAGTRSPGDRRPLELDDLVGLVRLVHRTTPIGKVRITGGEPLVRRGVPGLVAMLRDALPGAELCLTTNGVRLEALAADLKTAGLDRLNVSLDAVEAPAFQRAAGSPVLDRVLAGIRAAAAAGFTGLKLNTVLMRSMNGSDLPEIVRLAASCGAQPRFIELMPYGPAAAIHGAEYMPAGEALQALSAAFGSPKHLGVQGTADRYAFQVDGTRVIVGMIAPVSRPFCSSCNRLRLDSYGRLFGCLRDDAGTDLVSPSPGLTRRDLVESVLTGKAGRCSPVHWPGREMAAIGG